MFELKIIKKIYRPILVRRMLEKKEKNEIKEVLKGQILYN
jgi:hypothetical protein